MRREEKGQRAREKAKEWNNREGRRGDDKEKAGEKKMQEGESG